MITAMPSQIVADDSSCLLVFSGSANRTVTWALSGPGTLAILSDTTDANGVAMARYNPGAAGDTPTVTVTYAS
ncbi:hypothetical protein D3C84_1161300 [compost metagenome]